MKECGKLSEEGRKNIRLNVEERKRERERKKENMMREERVERKPAKKERNKQTKQICTGKREHYAYASMAMYGWLTSPTRYIHTLQGTPFL